MRPPVSSPVTSQAPPAAVEPTDDALVARVAKGDRLAFCQLVARHQPRLLALMTRTLGSRAAAEDVVQDVLTKAWINAPRWESRGNGAASYGAWLSRVAMNLAIDQTRKVRPVALDLAPESVDPAPLAETVLIQEERAERVRAAIATLPERQRQAVSLTYDAGLSNAEGAAAMDTSLGAFELLLVRARQTLRKALRNEKDDGSRTI